MFSERSKGREIEDEQMNFDVSEEDLKDDKGGEDDQSEEKKTFKEKLQAVQDVTAMVQNALGIVAHLAEGLCFFSYILLPKYYYLLSTYLVLYIIFCSFTNFRSEKYIQFHGTIFILVSHCDSCSSRSDLILR